MTGLVLVLAYAVAWFPSAVVMTRTMASKPRCQGEGRDYRWGFSQFSCRRFDPATCWRSNERPSLLDVTLGMAAALIWPLAMVAVGVYLAATRAPVRPRLLTADQLAELERQAGIGDDR